MFIALAVMLAICGAALGSFACCQVWRVRNGDKSKWSHCMYCKYRLRWFDNIPVLSWLFLGGKCRKCHKKIGHMELLTELGMGLVFALSWILWPWSKVVMSGNIIEIMRLVIYFCTLTSLCIAFVYDAKWMELPMIAVYFSIFFAFAFWVLGFIQNTSLNGFEWQKLLSLGLGMLVLVGFYLFSYKLSNEKWVGGGDYWLCIALVFLLGNFWLSLVCLFVSNLIGSLIMLPVMLSRKLKALKKRNKKLNAEARMVPMGPFLILGCLVVLFAQNFIFEFMMVGDLW